MYTQFRKKSRDEDQVRFSIQAVKILQTILSIALFFVGSLGYSATKLETKQFDINYYHLISLDPVGTSKKKLIHAEGEGNPERWSNLSKDDLSMIDWLENRGVPFCHVEGARLVYHKKRELVDAIESGEENLGVIEVTNTPTNLGIIEYRLISRTNAYLRLQKRASEQIEIEGFPMPHEIGPSSFVGLDSDDLTIFLEDWKKQLPDERIHYVESRGYHMGRSLLVRSDPQWCRERGFWGFKERWVQFSEEKWSNIYDSAVVRESLASDDISQVFISFLAGQKSEGVVVGEGINEPEFSSVTNAFLKIKKIEFKDDYIMDGSRAIDLLKRLMKWESGYLLIFEGGFQISCSMRDDVLAIGHIMYSGH